MQILGILQEIYPMSAQLKENIANTLKTEKINKKDILLKEGKISSRMYFIEQGLFRSYYMNSQNKEICAWFMKEGDVVTSVESFFKQIPSNETIQALENSIAYSISYTQLQELYKAHLEFNYIARVLTEKYYCQSEQRLYWLRQTRAKDRYRLFLEAHPEFIQRVQSTYIASFLGLTLETLSRIKRI